MLILPAIDIKDGKVVRLIRGDFKQETVYSDKPQEVAFNWQQKGAQMLHVVDLDGALTGYLKNLSSIVKILGQVHIPIEVGGGIRSYHDLEKLINLGIQRVILSTVAYKDKDLLKKALSNFADKIAVSIDAKENKVMVEGWAEDSHLDIFKFTKDLEDLGVKTIIYTDIESDGTLAGVKINRIKDFLNNTKLSCLVSGGISSMKDLIELKKLEALGLEGVIIGKALYDERISLEKALKI
jgi:phosphoribosylformimino-5-aminoimidazole carboxamide ribotide isomerase